MRTSVDIYECGNAVNLSNGEMWDLHPDEDVTHFPGAFLTLKS